MVAKNDADRESYQVRLKWERNQAAFIEEAREEGREEGRKEGKLVAGIHLCQRMLKVALTPEENLLRLPPEELQTQANALEQQLGIG